MFCWYLSYSFPLACGQWWRLMILLFICWWWEAAPIGGGDSGHWGLREDAAGAAGEGGGGRRRQRRRRGGGNAKMVCGVCSRVHYSTYLGEASKIWEVYRKSAGSPQELFCQSLPNSYCMFDLNSPTLNWRQFHREFWWANQPILWLHWLVYQVN